jgi:8-oxo-dGTP pyrophosphatase MutT (NUDIX family)
VRGGGIEFLLVRTRGGGRWTFPKGSAEAGLTHAQAAALEAFEEAGVHGRIEEASFARYIRRLGQRSGSRVERKVAVWAHLCQVLRLSPPQESERNRTWFSVEEARDRLREGRSRKDGAALARVIERAAARIEATLQGTGFREIRRQQNRLHRERARAPQRDGLQAVRFDFAEGYGRLQEASFLRQLTGLRKAAVTMVDVPRDEVLPCEVLEFGSPKRLSGRGDPRS